MPTTPEAAPEVGPRARRAVQWSLALLAATMLLLLVGPRWGVLTLAVAPAAAAAMVTALVLLRSTRGLLALKVMLGIGVGVSMVAILYGLGLVIFSGPVQDLVACQERALTQTAQRQCLEDYQQAYVDLLARWGLTLP